MTMSTADWREAVAAARPPLTAAQLAALRPVCQRMATRINGNAAPARQRGPRPETPETTPERNTA